MKTNYTQKSMLVVDAATNLPIDLPQNLQEEIAAPVVALRKWVLKRKKTSRKTKVDKAGRIHYALFPKQTILRDLDLTYNEATGEITGGIFGAAENVGGQSMIGGVKSTYGIAFVTDYIEMAPAKFLKHKIFRNEIQEEGLENLVALKMEDVQNTNTDATLKKLKTLWVNHFGTAGTMALSVLQQNKWTLPANANKNHVSLRKKAKTYTDDDAGAKELLKDIKNTLLYRDKIGTDVEINYPFTWGMNTAKTGFIELSAGNNERLMNYVQNSNNGFVTGLGADKKLGIIKYISYLGKSVPVEVIDDMPASNGKAFNWSIVGTGENGALGMPTKWDPLAVLVGDATSIITQFADLVVVVPQQGFKALQPELDFASFEA